MIPVHYLPTAQSVVKRENTLPLTHIGLNVWSTLESSAADGTLYEGIVRAPPAPNEVRGMEMTSPFICSRNDLRALSIARSAFKNTVSRDDETCQSRSVKFLQDGHGGPESEPPHIWAGYRRGSDRPWCLVRWRTADKHSSIVVSKTATCWDTHHN